MSNAAKDDLHQLIDALPESEVPAARRYLQFLGTQTEDAVHAAIANAPYDDEDADWDESEAAAGRADVSSGRVGTP